MTRRLTAALLIVCAALVIVGVSLETEESAAEEGSLESFWPLAGLAVASLGLAFLIWRQPTRLIAGAVIAFSAGAAVFDVLELTRQHSGLVLLAVVIVILRLTTITAAALLWRTTHSASESHAR